jgi:hypothetical protein
MPTNANAHPRALVANVDANAQLMLTLMLAFPTSSSKIVNATE